MARPDYGRARWYGANRNGYSPATRPGSNRIDKIIVHITQGSWTSAINWFADARSGVSAHYVVRSSDGFIGQCVEEKDISYHAGNWPVNQTSVGIEHEGYGNNPDWLTGAMYDSSARLSAYLVDKYDIPISRNNFLAHRQVSSTLCPGNYWDWDRYLGLVRQYAGSGGDSEENSGSGYSQIVDNGTSGRFSASGGWGRSSYSSQIYGRNYRFARPASTNDTAKYRFNVPARGYYNVSARWPANSGYNASTPIGIRTTSGLRWVRVNQQRNGGRWVSLGTFNLAAGDAEKVVISRWTSGRGYVIADAVRITAA
jgi:hypothetical protein